MLGFDTETKKCIFSKRSAVCRLFFNFVVFHSGTGSDVSCIIHSGLIQSVSDVSVKKGIFDCQT